MLERRINAFNDLQSRFTNSTRVNPLTIVHSPSSRDFQDLYHSVETYMGGSLKDYEEKLPPQVTPNGMIVPKRNTVIEYNMVVRSFARIMDRLGFGDLVESWHIPLNVRFKGSVVSELNMRRKHPTEHAHSDSWAGESSESVTVHIPIMGDCQKNYVQMFYPDDEFKDAWLGPRKSYADGHELLTHYTPVNYITPMGGVAFMDFATLHASTRLENAGPRVSIDTTFVLKKDWMSEKIHKWRKGERLSDSMLKTLGETHIFYFPDSPESQVDTRGGFKHPTKLKLVKIARNPRSK